MTENQKRSGEETVNEETVHKRESKVKGSNVNTSRIGEFIGVRYRCCMQPTSFNMFLEKIINNCMTRRVGIVTAENEQSAYASWKHRYADRDEEQINVNDKVFGQIT